MFVYTQKQLEWLIRFFHPEKKYPFLRGAHNPAAHAALFGIREQLYVRMKEGLQAKVAQAGDELLEKVAFQSAIKSVPLRPGAKIVVSGDSQTDDLLSWLAILEYVFTKVRPEDDISFVNLAISGDTSTQLLGAVITAVEQNADLYLNFIGTNDIRKQGGDSYKPATSLTEVQANIDSVTQYFNEHTNVPVLWMTPACVIEERIQKDYFIQQIKASWADSDLEQVTTLIDNGSREVLNLRTLFQSKDIEYLIDQDGLHFTLTGHQLVTEAVVTWLSSVDL